MNIRTASHRKGDLIAIGGAEDKTSGSDILTRVLALAPHDKRKVAVVTTASGIPEETFEGYHAAFTGLGAEAVTHLNVRDRADADDPAHLEVLRGCGVVFFSGGDQMRLTTILGASAVLNAIRAHLAHGGVVAGTSAGAACICSTMIYGGDVVDSLRKGAVRMTAGLGFVTGLIIDTHFLERGRFTRLMEAGATSPEQIGVGIGEDAAVIIHDGTLLEVVGPGHVVIVDSAGIIGSNIAELEDGAAVAVENVVMHALIEGYGYDVRTRRPIRPEHLNTAIEGNDKA